MKNIIDLIPHKKKRVSPAGFLRLTPKEKRNIQATQFVPPAIGSESFGEFVITWKTPVYAVEHGEE